MAGHEPDCRRQRRGRSGTRTLYSVALDASPHAQFVVDVSGRLLGMFNDAVRALFAFGPGDMGRRFHDLEA